MAGAKENDGNGLAELVSSAGTAAIVVLACVTLFSFMRPRFPLVYQAESQPGTEPNSSSTKWIGQAWHATHDEIEERAGLDHANLVTFTELATRILRVLGIPLALVLVPVHFMGTGAGDDKLGWLGMANLPAESWAYWLHTAAVWYVVWVVMAQVDDAMAKFIPERHQWLLDLPYPRSLTVLIEDIPKGRNTEEQLKTFFDEEVFGRPVVDRAYIVKNTSILLAAKQKLGKLNLAIERATKPKTGDFSEALHGQFDLALPVLMSQRKDTEREIEELRGDLNRSTAQNSTAAFVEFKERRDKVIALKMFSAEDNEEIVVQVPPDHPDIRWRDLQSDTLVMQGKEYVGNLMILGMMFALVPTVVFIQSFARLENLSSWNPLSNVEQSYPAVVTIWNGIVATSALSIVMGFVPMLLTIIFEASYKMVDEGFVQYLVQQWYFIFLVLFVLLVSVLGSSLFKTAIDLLTSPVNIFGLLAASLPSRTAFYLSYIVVQTQVDAIALTRVVQLLQFTGARAIKGEEKAKLLSEPEDPAGQGMGGRSARLTLLLSIPIVFCTMCPLMCFVALFNFWLARLVYSYLFLHAETRKGDLGGFFYVKQLQHIQYVMLIFIFTMVGVLFERGPSKFCGWIALGSVLLWIRMYRSFYRSYHWESLDFQEVTQMEKKQAMTLAQSVTQAFAGSQPSKRSPYEQEELQDPALAGQGAGDAPSTQWHSTLTFLMGAGAGKAPPPQPPPQPPPAALQTRPAPS